MCWRKNLDSMHKRMVAAMDNKIPGICHDVTFLVGKDQVPISCHKIFLVIASPVFETMFSQRHSSHTQETPTTEGECKPLISQIVIPDVDPDGLKNIIKYAYTGILNVDVKDSTATMFACDKYDIPELYEHCTKLLHTKLSVDNAVTVYQAALILTDENLEKNTWEFIEANAADLLDSDQFLEFSGDNLLKFLSLDSMPGLRSEVDVFKALIRWGRLECDQRGIDTTKENMRSVLEPYLSLIRFPTMEADEFIEEVQNCGVLRSKACVDLLNYFILSGEKRAAICATLQYSCKRRMNGKFVFFCAAINENSEIRLKTQTSADQFIITGNAGAIVKLKSVGIVLPSNSTQCGKKKVSICLYDHSIGKWIHSTTGEVSKSLKTSYIEFDPPVSLQLNVKYELAVNWYHGYRLPTAKSVELVQYSKELMKESTFTWSTANGQQFNLEFIPMYYTIWALQFEN